MMRYIMNIGLTLCVLLVSACNKFLELKPDIKMAIPTTLEDADLLLNDYSTLNGGYPIWGEIGSDDYYVTKDKWEAAASIDQRNAYLWLDEPYTDVSQWQKPYKTIYMANQVKDVLAKLNNNDEPAKYNRLMGGAHFFRAYALLQLTEVHCPAYTAEDAGEQLGLPIRLSPDIDKPSHRASLQDTYAQIVADFKAATNNLPVLEGVKGRPVRASAYGALARTYLNMSDYQQAYRYADSCILLSPTLLDYNMLKISDALPIPKFNVEVLFPATTVNLGILGATSALMDSTLYDMYDVNDLRKGIFFKENTTMPNSYYFKGSYDKSSATLFTGITTSEVYLIKAESACRIGQIDVALSALNTLLAARWKSDVPISIKENNPDSLLRVILEERRKELLFRGRRWADLKRLNLDSRFQKALEREIGDKTYKIEPNSPKYAFRLSENVIKLGGYKQNKR